MLSNVGCLFGIVELGEELLLLREVVVRVVNQALQQRCDLLLSLRLFLRSALARKRQLDLALHQPASVEIVPDDGVEHVDVLDEMLVSLVKLFDSDRERVRPDHKLAVLIPTRWQGKNLIFHDE